jgi:DNA-binding Lrp family transcriptional regulator
MYLERHAAKEQRAWRRLRIVNFEFVRDLVSHISYLTSSLGFSNLIRCDLEREGMQEKHSKENQNNAQLDEMDRMILNEIQSHFPIEARPYRVLAETLGCSEEEVLQRVQDLKNREVIRRIGANCNSRKLGYTSTLCAAKVPSRLMERFVEVVNSYMGVTHNYRRDHDYNIWFTLIAPSKEKIESILGEIVELTEVEEIISLPAERLFKIQVDFEV